MLPLAQVCMLQQASQTAHVRKEFLRMKRNEVLCVETMKGEAAGWPLEGGLSEDLSSAPSTYAR